MPTRDELRQLSDAATPGPWSVDEGIPVWSVTQLDDEGKYITDIAYTVGSEEESNAVFIAALVNAYRAGELVPSRICVHGERGSHLFKFKGAEVFCSGPEGN